MCSAVKRLSSLIMVLFLMLSCFCVSVSAEEEETEDQENGQMNLDVVFVVDSSGSMAEADPNRVAVDAFNLFVDLCDASCGVGYTVYSEQIKDSQDIALLDKNQLSSLKNKMSQINRNPAGDTDIALGLTTAMNIHKNNKNRDSNRRKLIILLSDGNTHLISGPRTVEDSQKELDATLRELKRTKIPVYAIGLNYDGTLDKQETQKIASQTNGKAFEAKASNELPSIIADIFADVYEIKGSQKTIVDGNVAINIQDKSVFYVNIIIRSQLSANELNPVLTSPKNETVDLTGTENVKMTSTGSYILIKLIYPQDGKWNLHLDNATNQNCIVTQMDFYSIFIKQNVPVSAVAGQAVRITASLNDNNGIVQDRDLLDTITMQSSVTTSDKTQNVQLTLQPDFTFAGEFVPDSTGTYIVQTTAKSQTFQKDSTEFALNVKRYSDKELNNIAQGSNDLNNLMPDTSALSHFEGSPTVIIFVIIAVLVVVTVLIFLFAKLKASKDAQALSLLRAASDNPPIDEKPAPPAPPIERVKEGPKATDPDYVDIPLVEHGSLESLIRKGPDDAFNANSDDYKVDTSLEAIIKKGPDNNLGVGSAPLPEEDYSEFDNSHNEDYQSGHSLADMMGDFDDEPSDGLGFIKRD